jgi:O-antigen/teichoic acid export membrane protein
MSGRTLLNALIALIGLCVNVALNLLLLPTLGMVGAAVGTLGAMIVVIGANIYYVYKAFDLLPFSLSLLWPVATTCLTGVLFYLLNSWLEIGSVLTTVLALASLILTYGFIYFLGATEPEEKELIANLRSSVDKSALESGVGDQSQGAHF